MKTLTTAIALSLSLMSVSAFAAGTSGNMEPNNMAFQGVYGTHASGLTRAQVVQELQQAQAAGQISNAEPDNIAFAHIGGQGSNVQSPTLANDGQNYGPSAAVDGNMEPDNQAAFRSDNG